MKLRCTIGASPLRMEPTAKVHLASLSKWRGVPQWRLTVADARGVERELRLMAGVSWRIGTNPALRRSSATAKIELSASSRMRSDSCSAS